MAEGELDEPIAGQAAQLCRRAGADLEAIPAWAEIGRERRANAGRPPFCEPKLGGRGDAERTVLTGGVPRALRHDPGVNPRSQGAPTA